MTIKYVLCVSIIAVSMQAMDTTATKKNSPLTEQDVACFDWHDQYGDLKGTAYSKLSPADQQLFKGGLKFTDDNRRNEALIEAIKNYGSTFYEVAHAKFKSVPYEKSTLISAFLNVFQFINSETIKTPFNLFTARLKAYFHDLTPQDRALLREKESYISKFGEVRGIWEKCGQFYVTELVNLKLIQPNEQEKYKREYVQRKLKEKGELFGITF